MKNERALTSQLQAWRSFRDIAHATSSLAASLAVRWAAHAAHARRHLARVLDLARRFAPPPEGPRVLVAFGTDMGLCGRLNQSVAEGVLEQARGRDPALCFLIGRRLAEALEGAVPHLAEGAPASVQAALDLADRIQAEAVKALGVEHRLGFVRIDPQSFEAAVDWWPELRGPQTDGAPLWPPAESAPAVARELLTNARLVHAACEAALGEARLRQATMRRAQDTAERRITEHEQALRRARQERITQEMLEALSGRRRDRAEPGR